MSCNQAGAAGPPFSPRTEASGLVSLLARWLPWNWRSIDGTGWCYNAEWDRVQRCAGIDVPVDWSGVGYTPAEPWWPLPSGVVVGVALTAAVLMCYAFRLWAAMRATASSAPDMREWLRSPHALPWAWEPGALLAAAGALAGLIIGFNMPLPTVHVTFASVS